MLPQQGRTVIVCLVSKQVYQMISGLAYFAILGEMHEFSTELLHTVPSKSVGTAGAINLRLLKIFGLRSKDEC